MVDKKNSFRIIIIGAGSWGTTLAVLLAEKGYSIDIWTRSKDVFKDIKANRKNIKYTKDLSIPLNVTPFREKKFRFDNQRILVIFAVPSHALREVLKIFKQSLENNKVEAIVNVAKGFEAGTNLRLSEVMVECLHEKLRDRIGVLSGPNISSEIAKKLPSVSAISSTNLELLKYIQPILSTDYFRVYTNRDMFGVEIGGSVKNIIAIAAGISDGLGYGTNTKASLVTRGLSEMTRFGLKLGAKPQTFAGISGMGDLITTCFSRHSRNRNFGEKIGRGNKPKEIMKDMYMVAEGINTSKSVFEISENIYVEMPITECVYDIIYNDMEPMVSVKKLMTRKFKSEVESY
ncbi:MAG: NAD(P)H-dependent glycerol-3-phosphate dehydrogenase [Actinomycetota bacterium]